MHGQAARLAVILHADVVGSTALVQRDESLAHNRMQDAFRRFANTIASHQGEVRELRGDALLAEFKRTSDAVTAALSFQQQNQAICDAIKDPVVPRIRVGIAMGEVIIADGTITGGGVVLAQRLEQLAEPDGVVLQGAARETIPARLPLDFGFLGERTLKGFDEPVRAFSVMVSSGETLPGPQANTVVSNRRTDKTHRRKRWLMAAVV